MNQIFNNSQEATVNSRFSGKRKNIYALTFCGLMGALVIVLSYTTSIELGPYIRIGFSGYPNRIVEFVLGPVAGAVFGGAMDILKFILKPTGAYFPGFTFSAIAAGLIYGFFLYKKKLVWWRVLAAEFCVKLFVNCILNTLWLNILYGKAFFAIFPARALKNLIALPVDTILLLLILGIIEKNRKKNGYSFFSKC